MAGTKSTVASSATSSEFRSRFDKEYFVTFFTHSEKKCLPGDKRIQSALCSLCASDESIQKRISSQNGYVNFRKHIVASHKRHAAVVAFQSVPTMTHLPVSTLTDLSFDTVVKDIDSGLTPAFGKMHGLHSSSRCPTCFSYPDSVQKECCIRSCVHFVDKLFIPSDCDCTPESVSFQSGPARQHACPHFQSTASLPELLDFGSNGNERIVTSRVGIPVRSIFGPLIGYHTCISSFQQDPTGSDLKCQPEVLDNISNWMKFVRRASTFDEQNLSVFRYEGDVYFAVIREISVGEELRIGMPEHELSILASEKDAILKPMGENWALEVEVDDAAEIPLPVRPDLGRKKRMRKVDLNSECVSNQRRSSRVAASIRKRKEAGTKSEGELRNELPEVSSEPLEQTDIPDPEANISSGLQRSESGSPPNLPLFRKPGKPKNPAPKPPSTKSPETTSRKYRKLRRTRSCPCCDTQFLIGARFEEHILIHCVDGKYPCRFCGLFLSTIPTLRNHTITMHGAQKVYCDQCPSWVGNSKISLRGHLKTKHSEIVLHKCPHCEERFRRPYMIRRHIARNHEGPMGSSWKPKRVIDKSYEGSFYKCRDCKLGFFGRNNLVEHLNVHHPETGHHTIPELCLPYKKITRYSCGLCVKTAFSEDIIRKHYDEKHKDDAEFKMTTFIISGYVCEICEMPFSGGKCFMSHVRSCHPEYVKVLRMDNLD